jgi:hypothetical protein
MRIEFGVLLPCLRRGPTRSIYKPASFPLDQISEDTKTGEAIAEKIEK